MPHLKYLSKYISLYIGTEKAEGDHLKYKDEDEA